MQSRVIVNRKREIYALVDKEDFEAVSGYNWYFSGLGGRSIYRVISYKPRRTQLLSRFLMNPEDSVVVDHINRNVLDNRRCNLRICTQPENLRNAGVYRSNKSGYKGVGWHKGRQMWRARIQLDKKPAFLGYFTELEDAVDAYTKAALDKFGEFAYVQK